MIFFVVTLFTLLALFFCAFGVAYFFHEYDEAGKDYERARARGQKLVANPILTPSMLQSRSVPDPWNSPGEDAVDRIFIDDGGQWHDDTPPGDLAYFDDEPGAGPYEPAARDFNDPAEVESPSGNRGDGNQGGEHE